MSTDRPPWAPRLTKDNVDLDALERERSRPKEPEPVKPTPELKGALALVEARRRARLAAAGIEQILGHEVTDINQAREKINEARALMTGAIALLETLQ